jgi:hypothetical protein
MSKKVVEMIEKMLQAAEKTGGPVEHYVIQVETGKHGRITDCHVVAYGDGTVRLRVGYEVDSEIKVPGWRRFFKSKMWRTNEENMRVLAEDEGVGRRYREII